MCICPICQKEFYSISASHLQSKHSLTFSDFRRLYPDIELVSLEKRIKVSESCKKSNCGSWRKGHPLSDEQKKKLSIQFSGDKNPFYNKKHSEITRQKMKENHADFSGNNNPYRIALQKDPLKRLLAGERTKAYFQKLKKDPALWKDICEKRSISTTKAILEGKIQGYGKNHKHGYFSSEKLDDPLYYRSSYEYRFIDWAIKHEHNIEAVKFSICYEDNKAQEHRYIPDFILDNQIIIEIKPRKMLKIGVNPLKFRAASIFAKENGMKFRIITETLLEKLDPNPPRDLLMMASPF